jgi:CBS domain-containing protein
VKTAKVRDLMVALEEYASVSEDATLRDAVLALEEAHKKFHKDRYKHRAILVLDKDKHIVGKVSQWDVIRALEPKYNEVHDFKRLARFGLGSEFIKSMMKNMDLWQSGLEDICPKAAHLKVKEIMYTPEKAEYVEEDTSLDEAVHQLVIGHHQSLLVTREDRVVGVLRLADVFSEICRIIKACGD